MNRDGAVNIADSIFFLNFLFVMGPPPGCQKAADVNRDCNINIADAIFVLNFLFVMGPPPSLPFPNCGIREQCMNLGCDSFPPCDG